MNVIDFPLRQSDRNFLTAAERQSIIATLYRIGITDYDQVVTVDGRTHSIGWTDRWDGLGWHIRKFGGEFALCDERTIAALSTSRRLNDVLATLV